MMRRRLLAPFATAIAATLAVSACSNESSSGPNTVAPPPAAAQNLLGGLLNSTATKTIIPLLRTTPLASDITVSQTIGPLGGTIAIPAAGLTLVVPPLAVSRSTNFSITARKGSYIAYDMEPHGAKFPVPLVATQSLANTNAQRLANVSISLGYYPDGNNVTSVTELLSVQVDLLRLTAAATIPHFSGYIFAGGVEDQ
jgi:hypothetical protein